MNFQPPGPAEQRQAIGSLEGLPAMEQKAFDPTDDFDAIPAPRPGDWLAVHAERGQTYEDFRSAGWPRPDARRAVIYLQPVGDFPVGRSPPLDVLQRFAAAFFQMRVEVLPPLALKKGAITTRRNPFSGRPQVLTGDVLKVLAAARRADAFCTLGITMEDLYPEPSWNFVFGQASLQERVGVYSFARYDPAFYGESRSRGREALMLRRSCKVLAHETCHMFGLLHCVYFHCLMNGSNHLEESDARPLHLCPVCLRKLQASVGFDLLRRYADLKAFYEEAGVEDEAAWVSRRTSRILVADGRGR